MPEYRRLLQKRGMAFLTIVVISAVFVKVKNLRSLSFVGISNRLGE